MISSKTGEDAEAEFIMGEAVFFQNGTWEYANLIDGGMTDNIRPALYGATYECDIANKMNAPKEILVDVAGKCCESGDIIRKDVLIPNVESGDIMLVYATGAYNYSMFSNYNNMLKPAVILVGSNVKVISRRETLEDLCKLF